MRTALVQALRQRLHVRALVVVALFAATISAALAGGISSSAVAANPHSPCNNFLSARVLNCHFSGSFAADHFCGTGQTVDVAFDGRFAVPLAPTTEPVDSWNNSEEQDVFTNPATGATVLKHSAYRFTQTLISGDPNGLHTVQGVFKGGAEIIRIPQGGVIARDAGNLVVEATFDGNDFVSAEIISDRGGHPLFANGDCSVLVSALGLT
jgi:hypothetical protein